MVKVIAIQGDITRQQADAIVNAASPRMRGGGGGGVDGAIHRAGGPAILDDCISRFPNGLRTGEAGWTTAGELDASWVIHVVGPNHNAGDTDRTRLESCYRRALEVADELGAHTVAFPLISAGIYGWPLDDAIAAAVETIATTPTRVSEVRLVALDADTHARLSAQVTRRFPVTPGSGSTGGLFDPEPSQWGLRGDPHLWRALLTRLATVARPGTREELEALIRSAAEEILGGALAEEAPIYVAAFDPGHGMSAGSVSPGWWRQTGIPLLLDRFGASHTPPPA
ncbi:macro domain-containing protein [Microbacterium sp. JZ31]|uniref:macro domain-containing protein n=1 Tax=Microbacterium sp. JZ31 TaxID=1906274 RepID=UPI001931DFF3|nr:macro domain-containing protein [Microbacterium sp. JZ31]